MRPANAEEGVRVKVEEDGKELTVGKAVDPGKVSLSQGADVLLLDNGECLLEGLVGEIYLSHSLLHFQIKIHCLKGRGLVDTGHNSNMQIRMDRAQVETGAE